jgi:hypothetical protein
VGCFSISTRNNMSGCDKGVRKGPPIHHPWLYAYSLQDGELNSCHTPLTLSERFR